LRIRPSIIQSIETNHQFIGKVKTNITLAAQKGKYQKVEV
jgi:hypothetical protein